MTGNGKKLRHSDTSLPINVTFRSLVLRRSRKRSPRATCTISINTVLFPNTPCGTIKRLMNCRRDRVSSVDKMPSFCATIPSRVRQSNRRYRCIEYCTFGWLALALSLPRGSLYRHALWGEKNVALATSDLRRKRLYRAIFPKLATIDFGIDESIQKRIDETIFFYKKCSHKQVRVFGIFSIIFFFF